MTYRANFLVVATLAASLGNTVLRAQSDDFDDGDDAGWTRLAPLAGNGIPATFSFPDGNAYRLESAANNISDQLGPPRVGAMRADVSYTDFYVSVDITAPQGIDQNIGLLGRVREPGLGTLDGYGVTYNPVDSAMFMSVINNEAGDNIGDVDVFAPAGEDVRMVFEGKGADLKVQLFALSDLETPLAVIERNDASFTTGFCGIFNVSDPDDAPTDSTFDNYFAAEKEPTESGIVDVRIEGGQLLIEFLSKIGRSYTIDESLDLKQWDEVDDGISAELGDRTTTMVPVAAGATRFYRIRENP